MKRTFYYIAIVTGLLNLVACSDFLETDPQDFQPIGDFYKTEDEVFKALAGVYAPLGTSDIYGRYFAYEAVMDDLSYWNTTIINSNNVYGYDYTASQAGIQDMWDALYEGIERANQLLEHIHIAPMDENLREQYKAETLFLRGFYHFMLASYWGDVPLKLTATEKVTEIKIPRTPQKDVFLKVKEDMEWAIPRLDTITNFQHSGRITNTAALGILARVCLKMAGEPTKMAGMYEEALKYADSVANSGLHRLNDSYDDIFIKLMGDAYDTEFRESMWEAEFEGNLLTSPGKNRAYSYLGAWTGVPYSPKGNLTTTLGYCYGRVSMSPKLVRLYLDAGSSGDGEPPVDKRFNRSISNYTYSSNGEVVYHNNADIKSVTDFKARHAAKWRRHEEKNLPRYKNNTSANFPILRYADVLLMLAEAENAVNGPTDKAYAALNEVRRRAGVYEYGDAEHPRTSDPNEFLRIIQDERGRELNMEGLRKFDLVRWGIFPETMRKAGEEAVNAGISEGSRDYLYQTRVAIMMTEKYNLFPIPQAERNVNSLMTQNLYW